MFSTWKLKATLGIYVFLVISIPIGAYLASQQQTVKSRANEVSNKIEGSVGPTIATTSAQQEIKNLLASGSATPSPTPSPSATVIVSYGPTLGFKLSLEGRPSGTQGSKVFVGITAGLNTGSQQSYLLSFTVDLPDTGEYSGISLAGLDVGSQYTAFIKPTAQIATSSAFIMTPATSTLNSGQALNFLTGDLNQDNVINTADYNIAKASYGTTPGVENWNPVADFNLDGVINNYDLAYITKNMGQTGSSGPWQSTPQTGGVPGNIGGESSASALPNATVGPNGKPGYWLWVPQ
ncbi:MAG: hypothetical protein Q7R49_03100 [Candidatus Daviesbacteria bacterium]|nr:hypothetical protein [Candidatus Daviesbacteria bacterium]